MTLQSKYSIVRKIADGGTAEIFLAKQHGAQGFEKGVVLKRIFTEFYADPQFRHMLVDEAHIAMSLNHSNIVQVLDLGEEDGRYFLALELVDGWTLDAVLRRAKTAGTPFPPPLALYVTAEVCRALAYAHAKTRDGNPLGIVHRDVSPHNVLISEQGEVKLTDFGIAKAAIKREQSLGNMIKGKIAFMSPEQASGSEIDARSDLFSLGTMLYVMITRHYPFDAPTDFETLMQVKSGDFLPPETARPGLNPELYRVIRKAMGKAPDDRYQRAEEMLIDVEQVMRLAFRPVGQTELVRWLTELADKDGATPLTRQVPVSQEQPTPGALPANMNAVPDSGLALDLSEAELVTPQERPMPPPVPGTVTPQAAMVTEPITAGPRTLKIRLRFRGIAMLAAGVTLALVGVSVAIKSCGGPGSIATPPPPTMAADPKPIPATPDATPPTVALASPPPSEPKPVVVAAADPPALPAAEPPPPKSEPPAGETSAPAGHPKQVAVAIKSDPDGAKVTTRHHAYGPTPVSVMLRPGHRYVLTLTKPGYAPATTRYYVEPVDAQTVQLSLKKANEPKKAAVAMPPSGQPPPKNGRANWWKFSR
ncbi:MAG TPA: protein kinase [Polyangia bacterium]